MVTLKRAVLLVNSNGWRTTCSSDARPRYSSTGRPLILMTPSPSAMRTRVTARLRRPVAAKFGPVCAVMLFLATLSAFALRDRARCRETRASASCVVRANDWWAAYRESPFPRCASDSPHGPALPSAGAIHPETANAGCIPFRPFLAGQMDLRGVDDDDEV